MILKLFEIYLKEKVIPMVEIENYGQYENLTDLQLSKLVPIVKFDSFLELTELKLSGY